MPSVESYVKKLRSPGAEYRVAPFWFWNHYLDQEELRRQVREMHRQGVGGFVMHPRHGRLTPYLSSEWMDCVDAAVDEAKKLGMWAWLYDEDNWPSGPAAGKVTDSHPEYRMRHLRLADSRSVKGGRKLSIRLPDEPVYAVLAVKESKGKADLRTLKDIAAESDSRRLSWKAPAGQWRVLVITESVYRGTFFGFYLDLMNPDATREFIEVTHEAYRKRVGKEFGKTIPGIFTDEPALNYANDKENSVPFTWRLPGAFKRAWGTELRDALPALFLDCGKETAKLRCRFYETVTRLYETGFFKPIYDYCEEHDIRLIGHFLLEGPLYLNVKNNMEFFRMTEYMHWGGVDSLTHATIDSVGNLIGSKMASSSSHLLGKERTMDEIFGLADGWNFTLRDSKVLADWHAVLGINYFIPHGFYYSVQGFRKWECIPDQFYHVPYWPYYRKFADHNARISAALSDSRHVADVAVFYPVKSMWAAMSPGQSAAAKELDAEFSNVSLNLIKAHLDFDYVTEGLIRSAKIKDGRLSVVRKGRELESFSVLVMPHVTTLSAETVEKIAEFVEGGGNVVLTGPLPGASPEGGEDPGIKRAFERLLKRLPERVAQVDAGASADELGRVIRRLAGADVEIADDKGGAAEEVVYAHYRSACDAYLILNVNEKSSARLRVSLRGTGKLARMDTSTGKLTEVRAEKRDGRLDFRLRLEPTESALVLRSGRLRASAASPARPRSKKQTIKLARKWVFGTAKANILPLHEWEVDVGSGPERWSASLVTSSTSFHVSHVPKDARLLLDGVVGEIIFGGSAMKPARVKLNGESLMRREGRPFVAGGVKLGQRGEYLDPYIPEYDLGGILKRGENRLEIRTMGSLFEPASITQPAYLIGNFVLNKRRDGSYTVAAPKGVVETGPWTEQGYPFYAGIGEYTQEIEVPDFERAFIRFKRVGDLVEIVVNGKTAEVLAWEPFEAEVTKLLKPGRNEVALRVANAMSNLYDRSMRASGILGDVQIDLYG